MSFKNMLIVLGCQPRRDGKPSDPLLSRVRKAIQLYRRENYSKVVLSGGSVKFRVPEADIMRVMLMQHIPESRMVMERKSRSTVQNALFCWELLKDKDVKHLTVVTSEHHIPRARYIFNKMYAHMGISLRFEPAPDSFDRIERKFYWLKEHIALLTLKLFGIH